MGDLAPLMPFILAAALAYFAGVGIWHGIQKVGHGVKKAGCAIHLVKCDPKEAKQ